jgi:hypothetical protein
VASLAILQYADDTILFLDDDIVKARNLKLVLCAFEKLSGLKINFHKSELFGFGETKEKNDQYVELFGCREGELPLDTWESQWATANFQIKTGVWWKKDFRKN